VVSGPAATVERNKSNLDNALNAFSAPCTHTLTPAEEGYRSEIRITANSFALLRAKLQAAP
jgi:hypothetical protein